MKPSNASPELSVAELAARCRKEAAQYQQTKQTSGTACLTLFQLALYEQNEVAWQAIYEQYEGLVRYRVHQAADFAEVDESDDYFVNEAFARFWQAASNPDPKLRHQWSRLDGCLAYLKVCVFSALKDYKRRQVRDALFTAASLEAYQQLLSHESEEGLVDKVSEAKKLWHFVEENIDTVAEGLMIREMFIFGLKPRQVQAKHPDTFETAQQVSQVKRNFLNRLRRRLANFEIDYG